MKIDTNSFFDKIKDALRVKLPFVAYRYPETNTLKGFFQQSDDLYFTKIYTESGFVFASFDATNSSILFPLSKSDCLETTFSEGKINDDAINDDFSSFENSRTSHIRLVKKGIDYLKTTNNKKIVLSRKEVLAYSNLNCVVTFKNLLATYSSALVYVWFHPNVGMWMGASPETLLRIRKGEFQTMALAGTQSYHGSLNVNWEQKEKQEQQIVTEYIIDKLQNKVEVSEATTIRAGSLLHICTRISGRLSSKLTINSLINLLHPTPAVCGLPMADAKAFIMKNEGYNREFYTGFFGEININKSSNLFVNLRCMQVFRDDIAIYIGGGITKDSVPEMEWEETVAKSKVMLKVLP